MQEDVEETYVGEEFVDEPVGEFGVEEDEVSFWVALAPDTPDEDADRMLGEISALGDGVSISRPGAGPGLTDIVICISILSGLATTAQVAAGFADRLRQWQRDRRKQGKTTHLRITRIVRETIDLTGATDEEVRRFIAEGKVNEPDNANMV